ncbi:MAG TPA: glutathione S-transferase family protein [Gammaproteobacteria bacterium]|nr:glutathione S-transferase family protein [Gammaproteobacteria bacterium]
MYRLYGMSGSGNCYKPKLLLTQLHTPFAWVEKDTRKGETRTPDYLAINPNGRVPLLEVTPGKYLAESNAMLCYLAEDTSYLPQDRWQRAQVMQWLFFEQYSHEPYIAVARFIMKYLPPEHPRRSELARLHERGHQALAVMEQHLKRHTFFVGEHYTIADIALYAYTHVADEGGFDLSSYTAVRKWLENVRSQPGHIAMS